MVVKFAPIFDNNVYRINVYNMDYNIHDTKVFYSDENFKLYRNSRRTLTVIIVEIFRWYFDYFFLVLIQNNGRPNLKNAANDLKHFLTLLDG